LASIRLRRVLDIGSDADDEPDLRVRKRAAVATVLVFMAVAVLLAVANLVLRQPLIAALAVAQIALFGGALLTFRTTRRLGPLVALMIVVGLGVILAGVVLAGGLNAGYGLVWGLLAPLGAVLFLGARAAAPAFAAVAVAFLLAIGVDLLAGDGTTTSPVRLAVAAINLLVPTAVALGLVLFIDGERLRAKAASDALLRNILPDSIADRLKGGERAIADHYDEVTVLFADVVEFTPFAAQATPGRVVAVLNELFSRFDSLVERYGLEKIKTIGDAYMVVAGVPLARADHAAVILELAIAMQVEADRTELAPGRPVRLRCGVASGSAVAGVIGTRRFSYDIWGDVVNLASRLESTGIPGAIQVAESTRRLCPDTYPFVSRVVDVKGKGTITTYVLDPRPGIGAEAPRGEGIAAAPLPDPAAPGVSPARG
jgi:guanylate cyclase